MRRFFIDPSEIHKTKVEIKGDDARHVTTVLRLKPGQGIELFDGAGQQYAAVITGLSRGTVEVEITSSKLSETEPPVQIIVAQAFLKEKKMDRLIPQLTELGITRLSPLLTDRSVARPDAGRFSARMKRWEKIATESLKQCKRGRIPTIGPLRSFDEALSDGQTCDLAIMCWENGTDPIDPSILDPGSRGKTIFLMMGPEGGFSASEAAKAEDAGFKILSLGPRMLKAETASVAACTIIQYVFGDMGHNIS
jgi:16S rRNA (uracil1498-N3)-methyltransferase